MNIRSKPQNDDSNIVFLTADRLSSGDFMGYGVLSERTDGISVHRNLKSSPSNLMSDFLSRLVFVFLDNMSYLVYKQIVEKTVSSYYYGMSCRNSIKVVLVYHTWS